MAENPTDEEQLARLRSWWEQNGTALVVGLVLVVGGVLGWRWYEGYREERLIEASELYVQFQEAPAEARAELVAQVVERGEGTAYPSFVLLQQAEGAVADGDAAAAEPLLRQAVELASGLELADLARLRLARVLFDTDQSDAALGVLEEIRGEGYLALAAELKGDIHLARGERELAHQSYTTAMTYVQPGDQRPVLEMKIADTAATSDA